MAAINNYPQAIAIVGIAICVAYVIKVLLKGVLPNYEESECEDWD